MAHTLRVTLSSNRTRYASCDCGWIGPSRRTSDRARDDYVVHLTKARLRAEALAGPHGFVSCEGAEDCPTHGAQRG
jgi:hypothetical protein